MFMDLSHHEILKLDEWLDRALAPLVGEDGVRDLIKGYIIKALETCEISAGSKRDFVVLMRGLLEGVVDDDNFAERLYLVLLRKSYMVQSESSKTVEVANIPLEKLVWETIFEEFAPFGKILRSKVDHDRRHALIQYDNASSAVRCCAVDRAFFGNRFVSVSIYAGLWEEFPGTVYVDEYGPEAISRERLQRKEEQLREYESRLSVLLENLRHAASTKDYLHHAEKFLKIKEEMAEQKVSPEDMIREKLELMILEDPKRSVDVIISPFKPTRKARMLRRPIRMSGHHPIFIPRRPLGCRKPIHLVRGSRHGPRIRTRVPVSRRIIRQK
ncbi:HBL242Wp [Eremothecium sinecaudum]|uniref:HBL242Wp n=1 Tax=Eremothecium sinecaudum TaxID=45286 RepID=A0A120K0T4_9SACH|nr:HBL242Wp [Eremothecium sinecaudum]AMD18660.1 HBL242Wp [Eremothecium sinecaudum]